MHEDFYPTSRTSRRISFVFRKNNRRNILEAFEDEDSGERARVRHTGRLSLLLVNKDLWLHYLRIVSSKGQANTPLPHQCWDSTTTADAGVVASPHQSYDHCNPPHNPVYVAAIRLTGCRSQDI